MTRNPTTRHTRRCSLLLALALGACVYEEPLDVDLIFPPEGTFIEGDDLVLEFTTPVDPDTLVVSVWHDDRDVENELPSSATPIISLCSIDESPCAAGTPSEVALRVTDDRLTAHLTLDSAGVGKPDVPLLLEVHAGLSGDEGGELGRSRIFDFQFKPDEVVEDPVSFEEGIYLIVSVFDEPLPNVITLVSDIQTTPDGRVLIAGAEADEIEGAAQNTRDPEELFIDETDQGFVIFAEGRIRENDRGERFIETGSFGVDLHLGPLLIEIIGLRFTGIVLKNSGTGLDQIQGTLSFEGIQLSNDGGDPFVYDPGTTTFIADQVPAQQIPPGTPEICGLPCGSVITQCDPPAPFPPEGFCEPLDPLGDTTEETGADEDAGAGDDSEAG